jgi:hypothetical protein
MFIVELFIVLFMSNVRLAAAFIFTVPVPLTAADIAVFTLSAMKFTELELFAITILLPATLFLNSTFPFGLLMFIVPLAPFTLSVIIMLPEVLLFAVKFNTPAAVLYMPSEFSAFIFDLLPENTTSFADVTIFTIASLYIAPPCFVVSV